MPAKRKHSKKKQYKRRNYKSKKGGVRMSDLYKKIKEPWYGDCKPDKDSTDSDECKELKNCNNECSRCSSHFILDKDGEITKYLFLNDEPLTNTEIEQCEKDIKNPNIKYKCYKKCKENYKKNMKILAKKEKEEEKELQEYYRSNEYLDDFY